LRKEEKCIYLFKVKSKNSKVKRLPGRVLGVFLSAMRETGRDELFSCRSSIPFGERLLFALPDALRGIRKNEPKRYVRAGAL